ncbi:CG12517 [Drosophila busckii]|uniref:CG12517 n=1 Tax=Drosophila busckii TaxID=30019 RepID=A0A0M4EPW1_DROBS|nr:uncharacterized protein LOC108604335 [Drosophila busckii]ALC38695.1 CG12517 [Drosophila busckii]
MQKYNLQLLVLSCLCLRGMQLQIVSENILMEAKELEDDMDLTQVNWRAIIPMLLQREQLRLCVSIYQFDQQLVRGTNCERLLSSGLMKYCDIGQIEDLSVTMRAAFGSMLFDTLQKCRPGLEIFGVRCRRRA